MRRALTCCLLAAVLAGCGDGAGNPEAEVRATLERFAEATAEKDYQALCDDLFAPRLVQAVRRIGLPCEVALRQSSLEEARRPTLEIGRVTVRGDTAQALVRSSAANQPPSRDTIRLVRIDGEWRITALTSARPSA